jgi:uncharacterized protein with von Willebrand factor type A (vWA) domain
MMDESTNVVKQDRYDQRAYTELVERSLRLRDLAEQGKATFGTWPAVQQDVWASLFKAQPTKLDPCPEHLALNKTLLEQAEQTSEWAALRERTKLDEFASAVATVVLSEQLQANMPAEVAHNQKAEAALRERLQRLLSRKEAAEEISKDGQQPQAKRDRAAQIAKNLDRAAQQRVPAYQQAAADLQAAMQKHEEAVRVAVRGAAKAAQEEVQQAGQWMTGFGTQPGSFQRMPIGEAMQLANRLHNAPKLKEIAEKAGRMVRLALHKQATKTKHGVDEVTDIETGNSLERAVPAELVKLADPATEDDFYKRYTEGQLVQYKLEGKEKEGRGPIIIAIDNSGSMAGEKEVWAKAFALGLLTIARKQGRRFALINFSSDSECSFHSFMVKPGEQPALLEALEEFFNGGTDFERPICEAVTFIDKEQAAKKADIVLVTDGDSKVSDEFLRRFKNDKQRLGFSLFSVVVACDDVTTVQKFSDEVIKLEDVAADAAAVEIFGKL